MFHEYFIRQSFCRPPAPLVVPLGGETTHFGVFRYGGPEHVTGPPCSEESTGGGDRRANRTTLTDCARERPTRKNHIPADFVVAR